MAASTNLDATPAAADRPISEWVIKTNWRFEVYDPALGPIMPAVHRFCSDVLNYRSQPHVVPYWLTVLGPSGVGKTLALRQAYRMLSRNSFLWEVDTATGTRLPQCAHLLPMEDLRDWEAPGAYADYELLYIEDIGAGASVDPTGRAKGAAAVTASRVTELLMSRVGKWTLLDANLTLEEISRQLDARVTSRLKRDGSQLIEIPPTVRDYNFR